MEVMIRTPFGVTTLDLSARQAADLMKQALEYAAQEGNEPRHVPPAGNGGGIEGRDLRRGARKGGSKDG